MDPGLGELAQVFGGAHPFGYHFSRVTVMQLFQAEAATPGDDHRFFQQRRSVKRLQPLQAAQVPFPGGQGAVAQLGHGALVTYRGQYVVDHSARTGVHLDVAAGHHRQPGHRCDGE